MSSSLAPVPVQHWMTKDLMTIQPDTPLDAVYRIMAIRDIRHMPVVKDGELLGLVMKEDVMRELTRVQAAHSGDQAPEYPSVEVAMSKPITISPDTLLGSVTALLLRNRASALAVVDEQGRLAGLVTESDIFRLVMMYASDVPEKKMVTLKNGQEIYLRPARPDDTQAVQTFYSNLSEESNYLRFLTYRRKFSVRDMRKMTTFDYESQICFVAVLPRGKGEKDQVIGIAEYAPLALEEVGKVEFAIAIGDEYQGQGLGTLLLKHLMLYGREHGVEVFYGMVSASNVGMTRLIQRLGVRFEVESLGSVQEFEIYIQEPLENEKEEVKSEKLEVSPQES